MDVDIEHAKCGICYSELSVFSYRFGRGVRLRDRFTVRHIVKVSIRLRLVIWSASISAFYTSAHRLYTHFQKFTHL